MNASSLTVTERRREAFLWTKRLVDLVLSAVSLVLLSPLMLLIAILIKHDSAGPALFGQERMGYDWRTKRVAPFTCYKFRSMVHNCDQNVHELHVQQCLQGSAAGLKLTKLENDSRITCIGHVLRKTSLDELPQLWNVLRGDMSLVGPRPLPLYEVAQYDPWQQQRLLATPGITGLWQIGGRGEMTVQEMIELDLEYIRRQSPWLDARILCLTIPAILAARGAR
jgi:lipopolysaccharide/colanic/teichoic acid biosynthesis glycosyltransferase